MKKYLYLIPLSFFLSLTVYSQSSWLRVNQIGYLENDVKIAVWISKENKPITKFEIVDVNSQKWFTQKLTSNKPEKFGHSIHQHDCIFPNSKLPAAILYKWEILNLFRSKSETMCMLTHRKYR